MLRNVLSLGVERKHCGTYPTRRSRTGSVGWIPAGATEDSSAWAPLDKRASATRANMPCQKVFCLRVMVEKGAESVQEVTSKVGRIIHEEKRKSWRSHQEKKSSCGKGGAI